MDTPEHRPAAGAEARAGRPPIMSPALVLVFISGFGALTSFYLLLSVVPLYATSVGAGGLGAGAATGALMLATVAAELATPRLVARFGYRPVLAAALLLLGAPALALPAARSLPAILAISAVRGLGFAVVVVVGGALVASLVPHERRGEGLGLYGVVVGVPGVVGLPLGVWLAANVGYGPVFVAGAVAALAALTVVPGLPRSAPAKDRRAGMLAGLATPALLRPSLVFLSTAMAGGVVVTFLPQALPGPAGTLAAVALLVQASFATVSRWSAGRLGDRHGPGRLLVPAVLATGLGMLTLVLAGSAAAALGGAALFGAGFGATQNASFTIMLGRVAPSGYATVSAIWNLAFDAGLGLGAASFGAVATHTGYPVGFALTAALVLAALVPAWRDRAAGPGKPLAA